MTTTYEITDRVLPEQLTAVVRGEMPMNEMPTFLAEAYGAVIEYLNRTGVGPSGPPFARYTFIGDVVAVEAGFPVPVEIEGEGPVEPSMLPEGHTAVTTHLGRYEDLEHAYHAIAGWLEAQGLAPAGPHWEVYLTDPNAVPDPAQQVTQVYVPFRGR